MKRTLTDAYVRTVAAPMKGRVIVQDKEVIGFGIRITEKGSKSWVLIYYINGRKKKLTLGTYPELTLADARQQAREHRSVVAHGADPAAAKRRAQAAQTVGEAAGVYIERWARPNKRSWEGDQWMFGKYVLPHWQDRKLREISRADVAGLLERVARSAPVTANRVRALLSKLFSFGISQALCDTNPVRDTVPPTKEKPREFSLTPAQTRAVWKGISELENERLRDFYKLAFLTCARRGELLGMTWTEIDFDAGLWSLPAKRVKNGRAWRVPLPPTAVAILRDRRARWSNSPYVFADEHGTPLQHWTVEATHARLIKRLGIPFRLHDARSVIVTHASEQQGTPADVLDRMLNHVTGGVTAKHYNRNTREPEHRRALLRWDNWLNGIEQRGEVVQFPGVAVAS